MVARLGLAILFICLTSLAQARSLPPPDERTTPAPSPLELVGQDSKGRDWQFYSKSIALVIGQRAYAERLPLTDVTDEMRNLKSALEAHGFEVWLYWDLDADKLYTVIDEFLKKNGYDRDARLLVYFSGHGATRTVSGSPIGYILPIDIPKAADGEQFLSKALPLSQFIEWSTRLEVKHALFLFDSCFSGAIFQTRGDGPVAPQPPAYVFSTEANKPMREFITAGSASQEVPAKSIFLDLLVKALLGQKREADVNGDGYLTGSELSSYLKNWVPEFNPRQTPGNGRPPSSEFLLGDIIFRLPRNRPVAGSVAVEPSVGSPELTPIFVGSPGVDGGKALTQAYAIEKIDRLSPDCKTACVEGNGKELFIEISMPDIVPANAIFDEAELSCVSGSCAEKFIVLQVPKIALSRRHIETRIRSWGGQSVWKLRARVFVPAPTDISTAILLNSDKNTFTNVNIASISVVNNRESESTVPLQDVLQRLQSEDTETRRSARAILGKMISSGNPDITADLIRGIPTGNYRYQIGVVEALSKAPAGWYSSESASKAILEKLRDSPKTDKSLKDSAKLAVVNIGSFAYYEFGDDRWLTKNGQLTPLGVSVKPLPSFTLLGPGTQMRAASSVYLRSSPKTDAPVLSVLPEGQCVKIYKQEKELSPNGGWLRVSAPTACR